MGERRAPSWLDEASALLARGWAVVPLHSVESGHCTCGRADCPAPGKHPRIRWTALQKRLPEQGDLERWAGRWPDANIGVVTGAVSGLVVLDVDPRNAGDESLLDLEAVHGRFAATPVVLTGGGGQHLYFAHTGRTVTSGPVGAGLDLKADGGLVVAPPSRHVSGRLYRWEVGLHPDEVALAPLPDWLRAAGSPRGGRPAPTDLGPVRTGEEQARFADLWGQVGITLEPGDRYYRCPFHDDRHPSLHVDAEGCRWHCFGCGRGGGLRALEREVVGRTESGSASPRGPRRRPTLPAERMVDVVGEGHHQDALLEVTGGRRRWGGAHTDTVATLVPEPENRYDPDAIRVEIRHRTIGYLPHDEARRYGAVVRRARTDVGEATCVAYVRGGWLRSGGDAGFFGVRLALPDGGDLSRATRG